MGDLNYSLPYIQFQDKDITIDHVKQICNIPFCFSICIYKVNVKVFWYDFVKIVLHVYLWGYHLIYVMVNWAPDGNFYSSKRSPHNNDIYIRKLFNVKKFYHFQTDIL